MPQLPPFGFTPKPYDGASPEEILALRKQIVNPAIFHYYKKPIAIVEGKAQYLVDPCLHPELRRYRPPQRLSRRQPELDGAHFPPYLKIQRPPLPRRPPCDDAR